MITIELEPPNARYHKPETFLPLPKEKGGLALLIATTKNVVSLVGSKDDKARFETEEWLLQGDGDVSSHSYYLIDDAIYTIVRVEFN